MVALRESQIPEGHAVLVCELCRSQIGLFEPKKLQLPLTSDMFKSIDSHHGFPPPFPVIPGRGETLRWEFAQCPICGRRPFFAPDHILTPHGRYRVGSDIIPHRETLEERNQREIERIAAIEAAKEAPLPTLSEINQRKINEMWTDQEAEPPEAEQKISLKRRNRKNV